MLAKADLLHGLNVTTHWEDKNELALLFPDLNVISDKRWVQHNQFITSGGISAGIDMSLQLVALCSTDEFACLTAKQMEYQWHKK